jgi:SAM-dependent methyltransferase
VTESLPPNWAAWRCRFRVDDYEQRWQRLAEAGIDPHGEVALVQTFAPRTVLDAGCGTGRVAAELARRGVEVVRVDNDPEMIAAARAKAPGLRWIVADLVELALPDRFDVVVLAGNVVPYVAAERRPAAVAACARHLAPGGVLVAGFALRAGWPNLLTYDDWCAAAGLGLVDRWATWDREPYTGGDYAVSVHARSAAR